MVAVEAYAQNNGLRVYTTAMLERKRDPRMMSVHEVLGIRTAMELDKGNPKTWVVLVSAGHL